jgi:hypothetical protein
LKMRFLIFVIAIFNIGCTMSTSPEVVINTQTDIFVDKRTGETFDRESFQRTFIINFAEDKFVTTIPSTKEKIISEIKFKEKSVDRLVNEVVIQIRTFNPYTKQNEFYLLWEREEGSYSLFQELPETNTRIFFSPDARCVH